MSVQVTKALYDQLSGTSAVTDLLSTYAGSASVFSGQLAPRQAEVPYVVIAPNLAYRSLDSKDIQIKEVFRDIRCYVEGDKSYKALETLAQAVHDALHDTSYTVAGHNLLISEVVTMLPGPAEDDVIGMIVTVRIVIQKT